MPRKSLAGEEGFLCAMLRPIISSWCFSDALALLVRPLPAPSIKDEFLKDIVKREEALDFARCVLGWSFWRPRL